MCPETNALHLILQSIIIDGFQRMRLEADIKTNAEAAARAFRAGLAAFTAPAEALTSGSVNATIAATVNYGGTKDAIPQQSAAGGPLPPELAVHLEEAARQWVESRRRGSQNCIQSASLIR